MELPVSIREFASMVGLTNTSVGKAIKNGTITKGVARDSIGNVSGVYPTIASKEWGKPFLNHIESPESESDDVIDFSDGIPDNTPKSEADRMIAVYKAKKARLEYLETEGNLIDKGVVYSRLYDFAGIVRDALMNVPDRIIDDVLAADGRNKAIIILGNEIAEALTSLSKTDEFEITQRR